MTYYKRHIDEKLLEWKDGSRRKPLLIRGARQVGKSTAVRELVRTFKYYQCNTRHPHHSRRDAAVYRRDSVVPDGHQGITLLQGRLPGVACHCCRLAP